MSIPRLIHFVWIGPPMPSWACDNISRFQELNPDFLVHIHGEEVLLPCLAPAYHGIEGEHFYSRKSDVLRISVLLQYGGWYFDTDFLPIRPLSEVYRDLGNFPRDCFVTQGDWVAHRHAMAGEKARKWIANGVIGTTPDSPFLSCVLRGILEADQQGIRNWGSNGPILFTELAEKFPGIVHVNAMDNWYRVQPRDRAMDAYQKIRQHDFSVESIRRFVGTALPYAMHIGMQDELEL